MRNIKLVIQYEGTAYHGMQSQPGGDTIQDFLERSIRKLTGEDCRITAAGRTDAGVHALAQVVNFKTGSAMETGIMKKGLNSLLPEDIRVLACGEVPPGFDSRRSATGKIYSYRIFNGRDHDVFARRHTALVRNKLDVPLMRKAAKHLIGRRDFSAFKASGGSGKSPVRTLRKITVSKSGQVVEIRIEADAFLRYMVRNMAGSLIQVGLGKMTPSELAAAFRSGDRRRTGPTAPARGLFLEAVKYGKSRRRDASARRV